VEGQRTEVQLACSILNTMASLGMPNSYRVGQFSLRERETWAQFRAMQQRQPETAHSVRNTSTGSTRV